MPRPHATSQLTDERKMQGVGVLATVLVNVEVWCVDIAEVFDISINRIAQKRRWRRN